MDQQLTTAVEGLEIWRKNRNHMLNNNELVLAVTKGQLEVTPENNPPSVSQETDNVNKEVQPNLKGVILITESTISR